jgi:hypothetical protein
LAHWNTYANIENHKRQYYIYNFNVGASDKTSIIGASIDRNGKITDCHARGDQNFIGEIDSYLSSNGIPKNLLAPFTKEEQGKITSRIEANKTLRKEDITFDDIKKALYDGGDVNVSGGSVDGIALKNAVKRGDFKSVELLIDNGAKVNLPYPQTDSKTKIDLEIGTSSTSLEEKYKIISFLISNGLYLTYDTYQSIKKQLKSDYMPDVVRTMIAYGLDPNLNRGVILRDAINTKIVKWVEELSKYDIDLSSRDYLIFANLLYQGYNEQGEEEFKVKLIDIILNKLKSNRDIILKDDELRRKCLFDLFETGHLRPGEDDVKAERIGILLDKLVEYGCNPDYDSIIKLFKDDMKKEKDKGKNIYSEKIIIELSKRLK